MESEDVVGQPQTPAAGPIFVRAKEWVDGATYKELHAPQEHPDPRGQRRPGVPGRLCTDGQDALGRTGLVVIDRDGRSSAGPFWGWVGPRGNSGDKGDVLIEIPMWRRSCKGLW